MSLFSRFHSSEIAVSVLTPIYNVAAYLPECLESLKAQTLKNIEFICINDGSTDESLDILKRYAQDDPRFVIIDKPNSGYGASMNAGLKRARGEYIGIVESDDVASPDMFKQLYTYAHRHNLDIVKSNYFEYDGTNDEFKEAYWQFEYRRVFDVRDQLLLMRVLPIIWAGLYRKEMLVQNNIRFNETPGASFQDTSFVQRCWMAARRVALLKPAFLHYRINRNESSVKSTNKVFEVCGEYALTDAFMHEDPERIQAFGSILQVMRMDTYRWNYNRITSDMHEAFAKRWADEYRAARDEGLLREEYFDEGDWPLVEELLANPVAFAAAHEEI